MLIEKQNFSLDLLNIEPLSSESILASSALFFQSFKSKFVMLKKSENTTLQALIDDIWKIQFTDKSERQFIVKYQNNVVAAFGISLSGQSEKLPRMPINDVIRLVKKYGLLTFLKAQWVYSLLKYTPENDEAHIAYIGVDIRFQGKDIGKFILAWINHYAKLNTPAKRVSLYVAESNLGAKRLYEQVGFQEDEYEKSAITKFAMGINGWFYMNCNL
ncbi:GNAT family N-acetyltransferase [Providencia manganoxydans]|uniref:GNAT family N-acetyltransferase n=1 Tax=Providencia manganoxydans TaxID=2923283 RepID=UPI0034E4DC6F